MAESTSKGLDRLDKNVVHEICTNQVVVTLHACVKELLENALDAGANRIEIRLRESGSELLEVVDNGHGISSENYATLAVRHATSKIREYDDLSQSLSTFGFRGEALSAIAAMGDMTVCTRTSQDGAAALLAYDRFGKLTSQIPAGREVGTTVSVRDLFRRLPVRHREFLRNAKAQVNATLRLVQSYAIAQPQVHFHVITEKTKGHGAGRATLLSTSGTASGWRQAAAAVLGDVATVGVETFELHSEKTGWDVTGLISSPLGGRRSRDTQFYFVNQRPIDPPKRIGKLICDTYHQYNSRMWPVVILSFVAGQALVDVNVTPDKRTVLLRNEELLLAEIQEALTALFNRRKDVGGPALSDFGITCTPGGSSSSRSAAEEGTGEDSLSSLARTPEPSEPSRKGKQSPSAALQTPEKESCLSSASPNSAPVTPAVVRDAPVTPAPREAAAVEDAMAAASSSSFSQPLKRRKSAESTPEEQPMECSVIELDDASSGGPSDGFLVTECSPAPAAPTLSGAPGRPSAAPATPASADLPGFVVQEFQPSSGSFVTQDFQSPKTVVVEDFAPSDAVNGFVVEELLPETATSEPAKAAAAVDDGFVLTEEYQPYKSAPEARTDAEDFIIEEFQPSDPVPRPLDPAPGGQHSKGVAVPVPAPVLRGEAPRAADIGNSFVASVTLADLGAAMARRRERMSAQRAARTTSCSSARVDFPSAFSLSSLKGDKKDKNSLEDVARFNTDGAASAGIAIDKGCFTRMRVIGQFNLGFIITALKEEGKEGLQLFIVDQHASDEKFRFEGLNRDSRVDKQPLVTPHHLQLTPAQEQLAQSHWDVFQLNGFDLQRDDSRPPGRRLRLTALPTCQGMVFGEKDVHDLLYTLEEAEAAQERPMATQGRLLDLAGHRGLWSSTALPRPAKVWQLLACRACRGAIMVGKALRQAEMERVLRNLGTLEQPWNCPHGRPTMRHLIDSSTARRVPALVPPLARHLGPA